MQTKQNLQFKILMLIYLQFKLIKFQFQLESSVVKQI